MDAATIPAQTHVIVTGGAGFIGSSLSARLLSTGAQVTILTRHTDVPRARALARQGATLVAWDVARADAMPALADAPRAEMLLHLAADVGMTSAALRQTNVVGTENALALAERLAIPYVLVASSIEAQGLGGDDEIPLAEERPGRPVSEYGASKLAAEAVVAAWAAAGDRRACTLRIGNVYGPGSPWLIWPSLTALLGATPLAPIYRQLHPRRFQPLYIDDLVDGVVRVVARRVTGLHNLPGAVAVTIGEFLGALASLTGLTPQLAAIEAAAGAGDLAPARDAVAPAAGDAAAGDRLSPDAAIDPDFAYLLMGSADHCHRVYDADKIRRAIGPYARWDLRRGLAATLAWLHACGALPQLARAVRSREGAAACT